MYILCRKLSKSPEKKGKDWGTGEGGEDSAVSGAESSTSPSPHDGAANGDTEDSSASDNIPNMPTVNPLKWTVSFSRLIIT